MKNPKVLVLSNNCFSLSNSNGRTLGGFFEGWPKSCLAQFCLGLDNPNWELCDNYYCVTDKDAISSIFKGPIRSNFKTGQCKDITNKSSHVRKSILLIARYFIWRSKRWCGRDFKKWLDDFKPDVVVFQSGESSFMSRIAVDISKHYSIPLIVFNTEGYYFFKRNYVGNHWSEKIFFPILRHINNLEYKRMMHMAQYAIYSNDQLKEDYDAAFGVPSCVLYTSSNMQFKPKELSSSPIFSYLGNFGFDRPKALLEIASVLNRINPSYKLDVYGAERQGVTEVLRSSPFVRFHGRVSYDEVQKIMYSSDVLFHAESNSKRYEESLKYGFSTKIADSISCGTNFILYAPYYISCAKYMKEVKAGWYVDNSEDLYTTLLSLLENKDERDKILSNAKNIAKKNHSPEMNRHRFQTIIKTVVDKR